WSPPAPWPEEAERAATCRPSSPNCGRWWRIRTRTRSSAGARVETASMFLTKASSPRRSFPSISNTTTWPALPPPPRTRETSTYSAPLASQHRHCITLACLVFPFELHSALQFLH
ncbi:hypothetical protein E2320_011831, partial [Naja naja]